MRLHPAESRVRKLAPRHAGDVRRVRLPDSRRRRDSLLDVPLERAPRGARGVVRAHGRESRLSRSSPVTRDRDEGASAGSWRAAARSTASSPSGSSGPTVPGERAMLKVKQLRTADCVVGGFRYAARSRKLVGSLLLGLYDDDGLLAPCRLHLGARRGASKPALTKRLGEADRAARVHRRRARRPEPLERRSARRMAAAAAQAGGRSALRPRHRRPLPPRHQAGALAPRQGAAAMHVRAASPAGIGICLKALLGRLRAGVRGINE